MAKKATAATPETPETPEPEIVVPVTSWLAQIDGVRTLIQRGDDSRALFALSELEAGIRTTYATLLESAAELAPVVEPDVEGTGSTPIEPAPATPLDVTPSA